MSRYRPSDASLSRVRQNSSPPESPMTEAGKQLMNAGPYRDEKLANSKSDTRDQYFIH